MKISLKWLRTFGLDVTDYLKNPQILSDLLTNAGLEVEEVVTQAKDFKNVVTCEILEKEKHPGADNLTLCVVSTGPNSPTHKIVCGAKNHQKGDKAVVALPGAILPGGFAIKVSKIRGEESQGMLCSEKELGLEGDDKNSGIMILPKEAPVGIPFSDYYRRNDVIFDIKVTPNRTDCLSHFGIVREICALTGKTFENPTTPFVEGRESTRKLIKVTVEDSERCPRYAGRVVQNVKVGPSPGWLREALEAIGLRSINNVVDVTNFVMMGMGQPLHAFDLSELEGAQITVRGAQVGEPFTTLDDKKLVLDGSELLICDGKKPVALAGVMGGLNSGVTEKTRDVFIESAYFIPSTVRRTARLHGIESDSSYRFSRGVDPEAVLLGLNRACQLLVELASGTVCADQYDFYPRPLGRPRIELDLKFISARLGIAVESVEARKILEKLGCVVSGSGVKLLVNPPAYRTDLKCAEDLGEEILRLKGFSEIPEKIPNITAPPSTDDSNFQLEYQLCQTFIEQGFSQSVNLNLVSSKFQELTLTAVSGDGSEIGIDYKSKPVRIKNPINLDLDVMRLSVLPSLIQNALFNLRHGNSSGALFEIAPCFMAKESEDIQNTVRPFTEENRLGLVMWGESRKTWAHENKVPAFFKLKGSIESFLSSWFSKAVSFEALKNPPGFLHPGQCARIFVEGKPVGIMGVLHPGVGESLESKVPMLLAELNLKKLFEGQPRARKVKPISKFPSVERDVALLAPLELPSGEIRRELLKAESPLGVSCELFDVFTGGTLESGKKSLAFRVTFLDWTRTLSDTEVNALHQKAITQVCQKLSLSVR
jgi:phenylalanyl-tRNA synthetase beta chain